jgi:hypothetical protein
MIVPVVAERPGNTWQFELKRAWTLCNGWLILANAEDTQTPLAGYNVGVLSCGCAYIVLQPTEKGGY